MPPPAMAASDPPGFCDGAATSGRMSGVSVSVGSGVTLAAMAEPDRRRRRVVDWSRARSPAAGQPQPVGADADLAVVRNLGVLDPLAVQIRPVLALEVDDHAAAVAEPQLRMRPRDAALRVGQHDIIPGSSADLHGALGQFELALRAVAGNDQ